MLDISVLMSVYKNDSPQYFKRALDSVSKEQTYKPKQIVIVTDGPVDVGVEEAIASAESENAGIEFTVERLERNTGLAHALNAGTKHCKYEYIARMDADDVSCPDRFFKQAGYFETHPSAAVCGGSIREFIDDENTTVSQRSVPLAHEDIAEKAKTRNPMNHMTAMIRKSALTSTGGYREDSGRLEDYRLWLDMIFAGEKLGNLPDVLVLVRTGNGFLSRRSDKSEIREWDKLQAFLLEKGFITKGKMRANKLYIRAFIHMPSWMKRLAYKILLRD